MSIWDLVASRWRRVWSIVCAMDKGEWCWWEGEVEEEEGGRGGGRRSVWARWIIVVHSCCVTGGIIAVLFIYGW